MNRGMENPTKLFIRRGVFIFLLIALAFFCGCADSDSSDDDPSTGSGQADDEGDDDNNDDASPDDDTLPDDDDDDFLPDDDISPDDDDTPYIDPLGLEPYHNDGHLMGVACGNEDILILGDESWEKTDLKHFSNCQILEPYVAVLIGQGKQKAHLYDNGNDIDLCFDDEENNLFDSSLHWFNRNLGYVGRHQYSSGEWQLWLSNNFSFLSPNDVVFQSRWQYYCLKHWDGCNITPITCVDDHPVNEGLTEPYLFNIKHDSIVYQEDGIWILLYKSGEGNYFYITHWDGDQWDQTFEVPTSGFDSYEFLNIAFSSPENGWALFHKDNFEYQSVYLFHYTDGAWTYFPLERPTTELYREICYDLSVVSDNEAWLVCSHIISDTHYAYYFIQILDDQQYLWNTEGHRISQLDLNCIQ